MAKTEETNQRSEQLSRGDGQDQCAEPPKGSDFNHVGGSAVITTPNHMSYSLIQEFAQQKPHVKFSIAAPRTHTPTTFASAAEQEGCADNLVFIKHRICFTPRELQDALTEAAIMELVSNPLPCPTVVRLISYFEDTTGVVMVMPYLEGGDLCDITCRANAPLSEDIAMRYFSDLIHALLHLKRYNLAHGDVSLENIMLTSRTTDGGHPRAVLIDMGSACVVDSLGRCPLSTFSYRGKLGYVSPEVVLAQEAANAASSDAQVGSIDPFAIDVWAAACCLYTMLTGRPLFSNPKDLAFERLTENGGALRLMTHYERFNLTVPQQAKHLICAMLQPNPTARPTLEKVLVHPCLSLATTPTEVACQ